MGGPGPGGGQSPTRVGGPGPGRRAAERRARQTAGRPAAGVPRGPAYDRGPTYGRGPGYGRGPTYGRGPGYAGGRGTPGAGGRLGPRAWLGLDTAAPVESRGGRRHRQRLGIAASARRPPRPWERFHGSDGPRPKGAGATPLEPPALIRGADRGTAGSLVPCRTLLHLQRQGPVGTRPSTLLITLRGGNKAWTYIPPEAALGRPCFAPRPRPVAKCGHLATGHRARKWASTRGPQLSLARPRLWPGNEPRGTHADGSRPRKHTRWIGLRAEHGGVPRPQPFDRGSTLGFNQISPTPSGSANQKHRSTASTASTASVGRGGPDGPARRPKRGVAQLVAIWTADP